MTVELIRVGRGWLALREPADAAARARGRVAHLGQRRPRGGRWLIHDLGSGTGSMGRWLAPLLPGPQHWVLHDRDEDLLDLALADRPGPAADSAPVTVEPKQSDITRLHPEDLADARLITASALLDMLTAEELTAMLSACAGAACPILLTLSVTGRVALIPADPLDGPVGAAFNAHQRRVTERGRLLGPDAVSNAVDELRRFGAQVHGRPSPWRLGGSAADLATEWFEGWLGAACEQRAELSARTGGYRHRRLDQASAGRLRVTVCHADLLVLPRSAD
jgi:hypothetical protein